MKKLISLLLCFALVIPFCGCKQTSSKLKEPVEFYYLQTVNENGSRVTQIVSEQREAYGHTKDLSYLLLLYLTGPITPQLYAPLPDNAQLLDLSVQEGNAQIILRGLDFKDYAQLDVSLICGCLAKTCFSISDIVTVSINTEAGKLHGDEDITIGKEDLMITDEYIGSVSE